MGKRHHGESQPTPAQMTDGHPPEADRLPRRLEKIRRSLDGLSLSTIDTNQFQRLRLAAETLAIHAARPMDELSTSSLNAIMEFSRWLRPLVRQFADSLGKGDAEQLALFSGDHETRRNAWEALQARAANASVEHAAQSEQQPAKVSDEDNPPDPPNTGDLRTGTQVEHLEQPKVFLQSEDAAVRDVWNRLQKTPKEKWNISQTCREVAEEMKDRDGRSAEVIRQTFNRWKRKNASAK